MEAVVEAAACVVYLNRSKADFNLPVLDNLQTSGFVETI